MRFPDSIVDTELGRKWKTRLDPHTLMAQVIPWTSGLCAAFLSTCATSYLEYQWPSSPFFFLVRLAGWCLIAVVQVICGLIELCFVGRSDIMRSLPDVLSSKAAAMAMPPLLLGIVTGYITIRVLRKSRIHQAVVPYALAASVLVPILCVAMPDSQIDLNWLSELENMINLYSN